MQLEQIITIYKLLVFFELPIGDNIENTQLLKDFSIVDQFPN